MILDNLKKLMDRDNVNKSALARVIGRDRSAITQMFKGKRSLKAEEAKKIAATYFWDITEFFIGSDEFDFKEKSTLNNCGKIVIKIAKQLEIALTDEEVLAASEGLYEAAYKIVIAKGKTTTHIKKEGND